MAVKGAVIRGHLRWNLNQCGMVRDEAKEARRCGIRVVWMHRNLNLSPESVTEAQPSLLLPSASWGRSQKQRDWEIHIPLPLWGGPSLAADGAPAAEKRSLEAGSHGQLMNDLLVLLQRQLPWGVFLINNH